MSTLYTYDQIEGVDLNVEFRPAQNFPNGKTIIYIHGGGFILGERHDLPDLYINMLNQAGYHLLLVDYPLAPEVDLTIIHHSLLKALTWFQENYQASLGLESPDYYLFGRSAGAYLAILLSVKHPSIHQKGLIAFYGYSSMLSEEFMKPNDYYLQFPRSSFMDLYELTEGGIQTEASVKSRFVLYINYRQSGEWLSKVLPDKTLWENYSLTDQELSQLPKTFLTASKADKDVPYHCSAHLAATIPDNLFYSVDNEYHDFDRDFNNPISIDLYENLIKWLN